MGTGSIAVAEAIHHDMPGVSAALSTMAGTNPTALTTTTGADIWHRRLGHPAEQVLRVFKNIPETGVSFEDSLSPCVTCKLNNSVQQDHPSSVDSSNILERLQLVSTDLTGPITPTAQGGYRYMAKFTDHFTRFKVVYFIKTKAIL